MHHAIHHTLALSGLLVLGMISLLTRPLRRLAAAADAVRESNVTGAPAALELAELPDLTDLTNRRDELGQLARALQAMVERLREQVLRVRRMDATRRDWVASISHDLRTPLTSLMGNLETIQLKKDSLTAADEAQYLNTALRNAKHLDRLSASLFDYARLDSEEVKLDRTLAQVGELLDDLVARFSTAASARHITLKCDYADGLPLATVDIGLIERAVANLIENALRYTPNSGKISVSAQHAQDNIEISVQDSGAGVPEADLARVFERFYQGAAQREGRGHAGLGLAIVKRVASLHGGTASVRNVGGTGEVTGACFTLHLPLHFSA